MYFYNARWYDPALSRFLSADSIIPNGWDPVAFDRYAYVRNSPAMYTDPSGHDICHGPAGAIECLDAGDPYEFPNEPPPGLSDGGLIAWKNMYTMNELAKEAGITMTDQDWLAYIIASEYYSSLGSDPDMNQAMTRRYRENCLDGAFSANCINGFWAYMQATINGDFGNFTQWVINPTDSSEVNRKLDRTRDIAFAILHPEIPNLLAIKDSWNSCYRQLCYWARINSSNSVYERAYGLRGAIDWYIKEIPFSTDLMLVLTYSQLLDLCGGTRCNLTTK